MADAGPTKPPTTVELIWEHDLVFGGKSGDVRLTLDSASKEGASPMQALAFALAGCMAMDVVHVLRKGRHELRAIQLSREKYCSVWHSMRQDIELEVTFTVSEGL